jgi:hypothetical protein
MSLSNYVRASSKIPHTLLNWAFKEFILNLKEILQRFKNKKRNKSSPRLENESKCIWNRRNSMHDTIITGGFEL